MPDATYFPIIVGVISFFASIAAAVLAGILLRKNEHAKWLRQERLTAYSSFLGYASSLGLLSVRLGASNKEEVPEWVVGETGVSLAELLSRRYAVQLLASPSLIEVAGDIVNHSVDAVGLPSEEERAAARLKQRERLGEFVRLARIESEDSK